MTRINWTELLERAHAAAKRAGIDMLLVYVDSDSEYDAVSTGVIRGQDRGDTAEWVFDMDANKWVTDGIYITGTVVLHPVNGRHYHSPDLWNSPHDAVQVRPGEWRMMSQSERDALLSTDALPQYPGEYAIVVNSELATIEEYQAHARGSL